LVAYVVHYRTKTPDSARSGTAHTFYYAKLQAKDWIQKSGGHADIYDVDADPRNPVMTDAQIRAEMKAEGLLP
jgi:hypothetical protein